MIVRLALMSLTTTWRPRDSLGAVICLLSIAQMSFPGTRRTKVTLSSRSSPIEEGFCPRWCKGDEGLNAEPFSASTDHRVPQPAFYRAVAKHDKDGRYPWRRPLAT